VARRDRYTNAFNIASLIAKGTTYAMSFPALENPIGLGLSYYASKGAGQAVNYLTGRDFLGMLAGNLAGMGVAAIAAPTGGTNIAAPLKKRTSDLPKGSFLQREAQIQHKPTASHSLATAPWGARSLAACRRQRYRFHSAKGVPFWMQN
jgi:hypothetical protein